MYITKFCILNSVPEEENVLTLTHILSLLNVLSHDQEMMLIAVCIVE